jgi:uncharacterized membrane protein
VFIDGMIVGDMTAPAASAPPPMPAGLQWTRSAAVGSVVALIALGLAWELWLAPLRPGGSWWAIKVLPLLFPLSGLLKNRLYTYRWVSLLVWLYFAEGVVRATSDIAPRSATLAALQVALCLVLFAACAAHVRWRFANARAKAQAADGPSDPASR